MRRYDIEEYLTANGASPFGDWLAGLKDKIGQAKLTARIDRASYGNFGDWKEIKGAGNIFEMREHYGPGYRIYYTLVGRKMILLLAGSSKKDQDRAIRKAKEYLDDYRSKKDG